MTGGTRECARRRQITNAVAATASDTLCHARARPDTSGLGKTATHCILMARLFLDGKDYGPHAFVIQLRSLENHHPLPGVELGDIGPKVRRPGRRRVGGGGRPPPPPRRADGVFGTSAAWGVTR